MANALVPADANPAKTSPKVKWGAYIAGVLTIIGTAVAAVPQETWAALGDYGVPIGLAVGGVATALTGYLKHDPAREPNVVRETAIAAPLSDSDVDASSLVLTEDQALADDPVELEQSVDDDPDDDTDPVARLARQVSA